MSMKMSPEKDFEDFMARQKAWRVESERTPMPARDRAARMYQIETDALTLALRSGDLVRLEAATFGIGR